MHWHRKKKNEPAENPDIVYLHKPEPCVCGGNTTTLDKSAPHVITSRDIVYFEVFSALHGDAVGSDGGPIGYISAFAAPDGEGTFIMLQESEWPRESAERRASWAWIKGSVFPALAEIAEKHEFAKNNGYSSFTHGLPENFGGAINVKYASGEKIYVADNQGAVLTTEAATDIAKVFGDALKGERIAIPKAERIAAIRFSETRGDGGYTKAELTVSPDGTAVNRRESKYDGPTVYRSEKAVDAETVAKIRRNIDENGLLAWGGLPDIGYKFSSDSEMTFVLDDGSEITVRDGRQTPDSISRGYFKVELEIKT
jgi:hypothetical protein